jgi:hypothetical protein
MSGPRIVASNERFRIVRIEDGNPMGQMRSGWSGGGNTRRRVRACAPCGISFWN